MSIEGFGKEHAVIYSKIPDVDNTGYLIGHRFFYPGDALYDPGEPIEILALPVAGPWLKFSEAMDYAFRLKPKICFPVHDGMLKFFGAIEAYAPKILEEADIEFKFLELGKEYIF